MTDYQLTQFWIKAQEDARRCYQIYLQSRKFWEEHGGIGVMNDCAIWQRRASVAAEHALKLGDIVTR